MEIKFKLNFNSKVRGSKKASTDGFNGYGKQRPNQYCFYGSYSQWENKSGIYYIKNKITNLIYIGSSNNVGHRISKHFSQLRTNKHPNHLLKKDFDKYGQSSFEFGVFELTDENLLEKEKDYQLKYGIDNLYNLQIKNHYRSESQRLSCKNNDHSTHKTDEYRNKMRNIKINRIGRIDENTGELLETFENSDEACNKYNIAKSTLLGCCNGSKKRAKGFIWRYIDKNNNILIQGKGRKRDIIKIEEIV